MCPGGTREAESILLQGVGTLKLKLQTGILLTILKLHNIGTVFDFVLRCYPCFLTKMIVVVFSFPKIPLSAKAFC